MISTLATACVPPNTIGNCVLRTRESALASVSHRSSTAPPEPGERSATDVLRTRVSEGATFGQMHTVCSHSIGGDSGARPTWGFLYLRLY